MFRLVLLAALAGVPLSSFASCDEFNAVFENENASAVLSVLATESGLKLVNPERATGRINATFEDECPSKLLPVIALDLGFELRVRGRNAWLQTLSPVTSAAPDGAGAGI